MSGMKHERPWHTSQSNGPNISSRPISQRSDDDTDGCAKMNWVKVLLLIFNIVFVLVGVTLVGIGIWTAVDKIYISSVIGDNLFGAASYMLIVVGSITAGLCVYGIYCIFKPKFQWIIVYLGLLILAALALLIVAIIAVVFQSEAENAMVSEMRNTLISGYGKDRDVTEAWDKVQSELECCAISQTLIGEGDRRYNFNYPDGTEPEFQREKEAQDSWAIYKRTQFYQIQKNLPEADKKFVPPSCCIYDDLSDEYLNLGVCQNFVSGPPTNYAIDSRNNYLHYDGCYEKAKSFVKDHVVILIAMGFVFAFVMIGGIFLAFLLLRSTSAEKYSEERRRREPDNL